MRDFAYLAQSISPVFTKLQLELLKALGGCHLFHFLSYCPIPTFSLWAFAIAYWQLSLLPPGSFTQKPDLSFKSISTILSFLTLKCSIAFQVKSSFVNWLTKTHRVCDLTSCLLHLVCPEPSFLHVFVPWLHQTHFLLGTWTLVFLEGIIPTTVSSHGRFFSYLNVCLSIPSLEKPSLT